MEAMETTLVLIHVLAAIIGIGPAFVLPVITQSAKTSSQLKFAYQLNDKINKYPKAAGITLLVTGILLMLLDHTGFTKMWLNISLVLFVLIEILIIGFLDPAMKRAAHLIRQHKEEGIPEDYLPLASKINALNRIVQVLTVLVIMLMVIRP
ncbi:DUF2269 family protein [Paenibacillus sp. YPG26]|uniref:DUF2269 family protein n=1 Tax=Paenibacillus sp. YPG26 TaxID=2878915 RepID=UPI00203AE5D2|nr:DUF2269 family protein [Paenibacillus sp. YPG26]USB32895.1 DUF2269 domain-containing protein [Paenibacillus sp. YPG26]